MIETIVLAIALSMDAFAISIALGTHANTKEGIGHCVNTGTNTKTNASAGAKWSLGLIVGLYFGVLHAFMPFIGYQIGSSVFAWIEIYAPIIAFILLAFIGGRMIYGAFAENEALDTSHITHKLIFVLAIASSIDAIAAGFTLPLINVTPLLACLIIGTTTFIFSFIGVFIGAKSASFFGNKPEMFGGIVLLLIGVRVLVA